MAGNLIRSVSAGSLKHSPVSGKLIYKCRSGAICPIDAPWTGPYVASYTPVAGSEARIFMEQHTPCYYTAMLAILGQTQRILLNPNGYWAWDGVGTARLSALTVAGYASVPPTGNYGTLSGLSECKVHDIEYEDFAPSLVSTCPSSFNSPSGTTLQEDLFEVSQWFNSYTATLSIPLTFSYNGWIAGGESGFPRVIVAARLSLRYSNGEATAALFKTTDSYSITNYDPIGYGTITATGTLSLSLSEAQVLSLKRPVPNATFRVYIWFSSPGDVGAVTNFSMTIG